jgi:hypothetical protein
MRDGSKKVSKNSRVVIGARSFAAISAVEGLRLGKASKKRLDELNADPSLTPKQRRAEVLRAYSKLARDK